MRGTFPLLRLVLLCGVIGIGCKTTRSGLKDSVTADGVNGYSQPGKGFKLLAREVTENVCVLGDAGSPNDVVGAPKNPDTSVKTTPVDPNLPPLKYPSNPSNPSDPDTSTPSTPDTTTPGITPGDDNDTPTTPHDPYSGSPFNLAGSTTSIAGKAPSRKNIDAGIVFATEKVVPTKTGLMVADQGGGASVELFYLSTTHDVRNAIDATYKDTTSIGGTNEKKTITADVGANIEANLNMSFRNTTEKMFILMHGIKTFPVLSSDVVTNPKINPGLNKLIFGDAIPQNDAEIAASYNTFRKQCGDYYVESVIRGREVWLVAIMDRQTFNATLGASVDYSTRAGMKTSTIAEAKKTMSTNATGDSSQSFLKQQVQVVVRSRGRTDMTVGNFTVEDAMERLNKILSADNSEGEGVIELKLRRYNNVRIAIGEQEKRIGDIFTSEVEAKIGREVDVFAKLAGEKLWVDQQTSYIMKTYQWDQWSLEDRFHNGIAKQYKSLMQYRSAVADVFEQCGDSTREATSATPECLALANKVSTQGRPKVNYPKVYPQKLVFFMPDDLKKIADEKGWQSDSSGWNQYKQADSRNRCQKAGYALPDQDNWKRIIEGSYYYTQWQKDQNPAYRAANDKYPLSYPCGKFQGANFWSNETNSAGHGLVVQILPGCAADNIAAVPVPRSQKFTSFLFWTKELSRYACVDFTQR